MGAGRQPARLTRAALLTLAAAVGCAADVVTAQDLTLEARLAADPARSGPAAWTWVRTSVLGRLPGTGDVDLFAGLRIVLDEGRGVRVEPAATDDDDAYAHFVLRGTAGEIATGVCRFDGEERWTTTPGAEHAPLPPTLATLASRFGFEARTGWLELDLPAAAGNLMAAATDGDLVSELMTVGALECGTVSVTATTDPHSGWRVTGRSGGGLALPAVLLVLADSQARRAPSVAGLDHNLERWLLLAASALAAEQEEAARQLSRFRDPRVVRALERLLFAEGRVRLIAMHGLARIGSVSSMSAIATAADPAVPGSDAMAARSILALTPAPVRDVMTGAPSGAEPPVTFPPAPAVETHAPRPPRLGWLAWAAALLVGATLGYLLGLRARR